MKTPSLTAVIICAFVLITVRMSSAAVPVSIWPVDALTKVFPDDAADPNRAAERTWLIPRNGHASLQFAVRSKTAIPELTVSVKLRGGLETEVRRVGYVPVRANAPDTPPDELARTAPARFPDPLFEEDSFTLPANETTAVWITVYAPPRTKPGVYKGTALVGVAQEPVGNVNFYIKVVSATVPARQTLKVSNWFYFDEATMAPYFDVKDKPDKLWELLGNIGRVMADHKQNVFLTPVLALTNASRFCGRWRRGETAAVRSR